MKMPLLLFLAAHCAAQICAPYIPPGYIQMPYVYVTVDGTGTVNFGCINLEATQFAGVNCPPTVPIPKGFVPGDRIYFGLTVEGVLHIGTTRAATWACSCAVDIFPEPAPGEWPIAIVTLAAPPPAVQLVRPMWGAPGQPVVNVILPAGSTLNCVVAQTPGSVTVTCN